MLRKQAYIRAYIDPANATLKKRYDAVEKRRVEAIAPANDHQAPAAPIYHSFGLMSYWHLEPNSPIGGPAERAEAPRAIVEANGARPAERWPIKPLIIRAMALNSSPHSVGTESL